jgi:ATP-dependent helicase/nuclease subunit A
VADESEPLPPPFGDATLYAFRRNVVVAASAGTGKTFRLTALYVLLTLGLTSMGQPDGATAAPAVSPERIVATTFSRAAAAEIAARVEKALRETAGWDGQAAILFGPVIAARAAALGLRLDPGEIRRRAGDALGRFPGARIDTLHGVARRIVQRHSLALGLSPGTRVLDEEEAQALSDLAVDEALGAALGAGGERAEAARALIVTAGSVWAARQKVQRLLDRLDEEGLGPRDLALADHLSDARAAGEALLALARRLAALGSPVFRDPAAALAGEMGAAPPGEILTDRAAACLSDLFTRRLPARGKRLPPDDDLDDLIGSLPGKTKAERAAGFAALLRHAPTLSAREGQLVDLLDDARVRLASGKRRVGALGFGDLLRTARDALRDRPEIARAVREETEVLLVDEFQDTSRVQRDLVYLLRERDDAAAARPRGAAPEAAGLAGHGLFLVGDRKQSIYGFRGADVAVFSRIAAELSGEAAGAALSLPEEIWRGRDPVADFVALAESRRSAARILDFVNAFSERDFTGDRPPGTPPRDFEIAYGLAEHLSPSEDVHKGPGRVVLLADDGASPEGADPIVRESSGAAREAHVAAAAVAELTGGEKPAASYKQVAVLTRRRSTIPLVELALARLDIPYVVAGRALYDAPEVRDVAALLRLLLDPRDRLALAAVLRGPVVALSDTALSTLSIPGRGLAVPLTGRWPAPRAREGEHEGVDPSRLPAAERARLDAFRARFAELRGAALRLPPGEAIRAAAAVFDLDRVIAALPRAEARLGNLDRLVTIARRRGGTLAAFVRWLERRMRDDADEAEAAVFSADDDAVRLTTIHASKGLDFPVVVLVDLNAEPRGDHPSLGFVSAVSADERARLVVRHYAPKEPGSRALVALSTATLRAAGAEARAREQAERRRLTYVALTRAEHTLMLVGSAAPPRPASALRTLAEGMAEGDLAPFITEARPAAAVLAAVPRAPARPPPPDPSPAIETRAAPHRPRTTLAHEVAIDPAGLALFRECPRRFRLRRLLGIPEPAADEDQLDLFAVEALPDPPADMPPPLAEDPALDPRPIRRAPHRVLARWPAARFGLPESAAAIEKRLVAEGLPPAEGETTRLAGALARFLGGSYVRAVREAGARVRGEDPFVAAIDAGGRPPRSIVLRGVCDLRVEWPGGEVDVLAIASARFRGDLAAHDLPLRAAALAVARGGAEGVRAGLVALAGDPEPRWIPGGGPEGALAGAEHAAFEEEVAVLAGRLAEARHHDVFEAIPRARCARLGCGFVAACHGDARA